MYIHIVGWFVFKICCLDFQTVEHISGILCPVVCAVCNLKSLHLWCVFVVSSLGIMKYCYYTFIFSVVYQ